VKRLMRSQFVEEKHRISCGSLEVRLILGEERCWQLPESTCVFSHCGTNLAAALCFFQGVGAVFLIQNLQVIILQNKSIDWIFQSRYWVDVEKNCYSIMFQLEVAMSFVIPFTAMVVGDFEAVHFAAVSPEIQDLCRFQRRKIAIVGARDS